MNQTASDLSGGFSSVHAPMLVWYRPGMARWDETWAEMAANNRPAVAAGLGLTAASYGVLRGGRAWGRKGAGIGGAIGAVSGAALGYLAGDKLASFAGLSAGAVRLMTWEKIEAWARNLGNFTLREYGLRQEVAGPGAFATSKYAEAGGALQMDWATIQSGGGPMTDQMRARMGVVSQLLSKDGYYAAASQLALMSMLSPAENQRLTNARRGEAHAVQWSLNPMFMTLTGAANSIGQETTFSFTIQAPALFEFGYSLQAPLKRQSVPKSDGTVGAEWVWDSNASLSKWAYAAVTTAAVGTLGGFAGDRLGLSAGDGKWAQSYQRAARIGNAYKFWQNLGVSTLGLELAGGVQRVYTNWAASREMAQLGLEAEEIRQILYGEPETRHLGQMRVHRVQEILTARNAAQGTNIQLNSWARRVIGREQWTGKAAETARNVGWAAQGANSSIRAQAQAAYHKAMPIRVARGIRTKVLQLRPGVATKNSPRPAAGSRPCARLKRERVSGAHPVLAS
jgi:hypothetical protein